MRVAVGVGVVSTQAGVAAQRVGAVVPEVAGSAHSRRDAATAPAEVGARERRSARARHVSGLRVRAAAHGQVGGQVGLAHALRRAAAVGGAERDPREWTGAQVVANSDRLLLGSLDEEFADNPDPGEEDWDRPDDNDQGPDEEDRPTEQELAEAAPRERQPSSRSQQATMKLLEQWREDAVAPCRDAPAPPRLELLVRPPPAGLPGSEDPTEEESRVGVGGCLVSSCLVRRCLVRRLNFVRRCLFCSSLLFCSGPLFCYVFAPLIRAM